MSANLKFIFLDIISIKHYLKQIILTLVFVSLCIMPSLPHAVNVVYFVLASTFVMYPFILEEQHQLDRFYTLLPVSSKTRVIARYIEALFYLLLGVGLLAYLNLMQALFIKSSFSLTNNFICMILGIILYVVFVSIELPLCFKYGYTKIKAITMILPICIGFGVPMVALVLTRFFPGQDYNLLFLSITQFITDNNIYIISISLLTATIGLLISYRFSLKFACKH